MARRQNHHRARMRHPQVLKGLQQQWLLALDRAAAYQHWAGAFCRQRLAKALDNRRRERQTHVEFKISRDLNVLGVGADGLQPGAIGGRLRQKQVDVYQHPPQGPAKAAIVRPRPVGDARVDHRDARPAGMRQPQKVWPEFGFREHQQLRLQLSQIGPDCERKVHGEVEDVRFAKALAGECLSGVGGGRHQHAMLGKVRRICSSRPLTASTSPTETA